MVKVFFLTVVRTKLALELLSFYVLSIISYIGQGDFKDVSVFSFTVLSLLYLVYYGILMVHEGRYYFFYHPKKILKFRIDLIRFAIVFSLVFLPYLLFLSIVSGVYFNYLLAYIFPVLIFFSVNTRLPLYIEKGKDTKLVNVKQVFISCVASIVLLFIFLIFV